MAELIGKPNATCSQNVIDIQKGTLYVKKQAPKAVDITTSTQKTNKSSFQESSGMNKTANSIAQQTADNQGSIDQYKDPSVQANPDAQNMVELQLTKPSQAIVVAPGATLIDKDKGEMSGGPYNTKNRLTITDYK